MQLLGARRDRSQRGAGRSAAAGREKLQEALDFLPGALQNQERIEAFLAANSNYQLAAPYQV